MNSKTKTIGTEIQNELFIYNNLDEHRLFGKSLILSHRKYKKQDGTDYDLVTTFKEELPEDIWDNPLKYTITLHEVTYEIFFVEADEYTKEFINDKVVLDRESEPLTICDSSEDDIVTLEVMSK